MSFASITAVVCSDSETFSLHKMVGGLSLCTHKRKSKFKFLNNFQISFLHLKYLCAFIFPYKF